MIKREIRSKIRGNVRGERLRAWRKKSVRDLYVGSPLPDERNDWLCLETLANGWCVYPQKRAGSISLIFPPIRVRLEESATSPQGAGDLRFSRRRDERDRLQQADRSAVNGTKQCFAR
jgi:hypothetical protein